MYVYLLSTWISFLMNGVCMCVFWFLCLCVFHAKDPLFRVAVFAIVLVKLVIKVPSFSRIVPPSAFPACVCVSAYASMD